MALKQTLLQSVSFQTLLPFVYINLYFFHPFLPLILCMQGHVATLLMDSSFLLPQHC